ncbi:HipA N-terminal domain-containing protein [PVC group bacterium]|nr:HipA N-terminal domain-containing protein [PVC group bacterium]
MRSALVYMMGDLAGVLEESEGKAFRFSYLENYNGAPVSLSMPVAQQEFDFDGFPPFFEGLLPEGDMLEGLLRQCKIDRNDMLSQLIAIGLETIGAVTVVENVS